MACRFLLLLALLIAAPVEATPARLGTLAGNELISRRDFMMYEVGPVRAIHYAEVAAAYGALRLAAASRDPFLAEQIAMRHRRMLAAQLPNTENHVDANVYGVWPLELAMREDEAGLRARGLALADDQWRETGSDGMTRQARYWIDDIWMIGALQIQAWRATRERRYLDRAAMTARRYLERLQQPNGLFHHGPEAPFFWGRGNGWVAAGLAEILSELPADHADHPYILAGYRRMMAALLAHQAEDGMWRQLVDRPESWKETSATAMFGFAMAVGTRRGLLTEPAYERAVARAWRALVTYVDAEGRLSQVCVGTGQSRDMAYYLARPTVTGDLHGQAALLWFAAVLAEN
jgi:hypothetical protein